MDRAPGHPAGGLHGVLEEVSGTISKGLRAPGPDVQGLTET